MSAQSLPLAFAFGPYTLLPQRQLLLHGDVPVRVGGRILDILTALVEQPGDLVTKADLMARVWPTTVVDEGNLKVNVAGLRKALGAGYIATVTGHGYRFIAPVIATPCGAVAAVRRHNLPAGNTRIVGRADAIASMRDTLREVRILSIVGPGGIGKTTVALAVAEDACSAFGDGVWLVDLAPLREAALLPNAIATALGMGAPATDMLAALCAYLRTRTTLLVLDSCEHMVDASAACVARILAGAPDVKILVTSREPLRVHGEQVHRLAGLGLPSPSPALKAKQALEYAAIALFVQRAQDRLESFSLSDADAPVVADICRRLDGLALAIELAATRIDAFGVAGLRDRLESRFCLLDGRRAGPERHRTLHATIAWSVDLLSNSERVLMRRLAVFAGAFSLESACVIGADDGVDQNSVVRDLAHVVEKSLVAASATDYRLLDTTRAYCLERLHGSGEEQATCRRHAEHVCAVLERAALEWSGRPAREWGAAYRPYIDDLRAALAWTRQNAAQRLLRIRLTVAGTLLWNHFSLTDECRGHVTLAVGELDGAGLAGTAIDMQLHFALAGAVIFTRGLTPEVVDALQRALAIARRLGDSDYRLRCLRMIGVYELFSGQYDTGMRTLGHFVAVAAVEDPGAAPEGETHLALGEMLVGRLQAARTRLERFGTHDLQDDQGARFMRFLYARNIDVGNVLSNVLWLMGEDDAAALLAAATVERARKIGHGLSLANALAFALPVFFLNGRRAECDGYLAMLDEQVICNGIATWRPLVRFYRGALAADGVHHLEHAVAELQAIRHMARMPFYLAVLADMQCRRGLLTEAGVTIGAALACAYAQDERWCLPEVLRIQAAILIASGCEEQAATVLIASIAVAEDTGAVSWHKRSTADLARLRFNHA